MASPRAPLHPARPGEREGAAEPPVPAHLAGIFLVEWEWDLRKDLGWQGYCRTSSLESAKREALSLVTGIPIPSVASRARVVSPVWYEPDPSSSWVGKLRRCQKVYAVYERAAAGEEEVPLALAA